MYCIIPWSTVSCSQAVSHLPLISGPCCIQLSTFPRSWVWPMNRVSVSVRGFLPIYRLQIDHLQMHLQTRSITSSNCNSKLAWLLPPSASLSSLNLGLQVYIQTSSTMAFKFEWSWPPSASPNWPDHSLQVRTINGLKTGMITASKCISQFSRYRALSALPYSLNHGVQVYLSVHSISASKCISKLAWSRPPNASPISLHHGDQVHL